MSMMDVMVCSSPNPVPGVRDCGGMVGFMIVVVLGSAGVGEADKVLSVYGYQKTFVE